jgi:hypothetical protein
MNAEEIVSLLPEFSVQYPDPNRFPDVHTKLNEIRSDPTYLPVSLERLTNYSETPIIWCACSILENIIIFDWVPRSLVPDPRSSPLEIRTFFVHFLNEKLTTLSEKGRNLIFKTIVTVMKVDFTNEGFFLAFLCAGAHAASGSSADCPHNSPLPF